MIKDPDDSEGRAQAVTWFAELLKNKLVEPRNLVKGTWRTNALRKLSGLLQGEVHELQVEVEDWNYDAIINEALDVAAYALMIADVARVKKG